MDDRGDSDYSRAPEPADLARLCRALNATGARYVLIGGLAAVLRGRDRTR